MNALSFVKRDFVQVGFFNSLQHFFFRGCPLFFYLSYLFASVYERTFSFALFSVSQTRKGFMCFGDSARYLNVICIHVQFQLLIPCELAVTNGVFFSRMFMKNVCRILVCPVFVAEFFTQETKKFIALWPRVTRASKI